MRRRMAVGAGAVALAAVAGFGGMAIAGGDGDREAGPRVVAEVMTATEAGPARRAGGGPKIQTFYLPQAVDPPENAGTVLGAQCPKRKGKAIGGGAATAEGIVVSYLSQLRPSNLNRADRVYWIGVDDNSTENPDDAEAIIEVYCAKGIQVAK
jgi:hypothetical protein